MYDAWRAADLRPQVAGRSTVDDIGSIPRPQTLRSWFQRRLRASRIHRELLELGSRDLAELGLTTGDIPYVSRGDFRQGQTGFRLAAAPPA